LMATTPRMIEASSHRPVISFTKPAASSTYTRMLLNWSRKRINGPCFLPSGKRLGPYFARRCDASAGSRPLRELVFSRRTTSSAARACQVVAPVSGWVAAVFMATTLDDHWVGASSELLRHEAPAIECRPIIVGALPRTLGQCRLVPRHHLVRNQIEQVADAVEACAPL